MTPARVFSILFFVFFATFVSAQGGHPSFGESHRQFERFEWKYISSDNFDAYYYGDNIRLAEISLVMAEEELKEIEDIVDYRLGSRSQILLFESDYDLRQSNLFLKKKPFAPAAYSYVIENKVLAAFNGSRSSLKKSLRYGIGELLVNELMYGGSFQERFRSSALVYMPAWFHQGLLAYLAEPWSTETDDLVRDALLQGKFNNINLLSGDDAQLAGHSWWNFVVSTHGIRSLSDILYLTRASRGYESALSFVLGMKANVVFKDWLHFYRLRYSEDPGKDPNRTSFTLPNKLNDRYFNQLKVSPNGKQVLLAGNHQGRLELWLMDNEGKSPKRIYKSGDRGVRNWKDVEPAISWNSRGTQIHCIVHEKGKLKYFIIDKNGKVRKKEDVPQLSNVSHLDLHPDDKTLLLSGVANGQSDLYLWKDGLLVSLTDDVYDDMYGSFDLKGENILFSSNRGENGMQKEKDLRFIPGDSSGYDIYSISYPEVNHPMKRITHTDFINEIKPISYAQDGIAYLSDNNGIYNTYVTLSKRSIEKTLILLYRNNESKISDTLVVHDKLDSATFSIEALDLDPAFTKNITNYKLVTIWKNHYYHYPLSNNSRNILLLSTDKELSTEISLYRFNGQYILQNIPVSIDVAADAQLTDFQTTVYRKQTGAQAFVSDSSGGGYLIEKTELPVEEAIVVNKADTTHKNQKYQFQTGFPDIPAYTPTTKTKKHKAISYQVTPKAYKINFFPTFMVTKLFDNSIINTNYYQNNSLSRNFTTFARPNLNARIEAEIADLFNDHSIVAGGRVPLRLYSTDFYTTYTNRSYKYDFGFNFFRTTRLIDAPDSSDRVFIHEIRPFVIFPLPGNFEFHVAPFLRFDKVVNNATDQSNLQQPNAVQNWGGARLELVYDRSLEEDLNFPVGLKAKAYFEHFQSLSNTVNTTSILGTDVRWYKKIAAKVLWANRLSATASFGPSSVNYFVGGTENWVSNNFNGSLGQSDQYNYVFNSLVSGIRGFPQNIRNGSHSLVFNSEIRIPLMAYFGPAPVNIGFLRTLQWVAFYDIGSAWNGINPFSEQHYNTRVIDQGAIRITVRNKNNPFISGFGTGLRSRILGYYVRGDVAWGLENGALYNDGKPSWYFSLGYDF